MQCRAKLLHCSCSDSEPPWNKPRHLLNQGSHGLWLIFLQNIHFTFALLSPGAVAVPPEVGQLPVNHLVVRRATKVDVKPAQPRFRKTTPLQHSSVPIACPDSYFLVFTLQFAVRFGLRLGHCFRQGELVVPWGRLSKAL